MDAPHLKNAFGLAFDEQAAFFRAKLNIGTARWDDLWKAQHDRAFVVAGAMKADLLADLHKAVAPLQSQSLKSFTKEFLEIAERNNWHGWTGEGSAKGRAWRARVIYETNIRTSYAAGRHAQLKDPEMLSVRPYWRYVHRDSGNARPMHELWGRMRITLRHDHPFWKTHYPPNGWFCNCEVEAVEKPEPGDATAPPLGWNSINPKTGEPPGIDKGWGYAPGATVAESLRQMVQDVVAGKLASQPAPIGARFAASLPTEAIGAGFENFFDKAYANIAKPSGKQMVAGALKPLWVDKANENGVIPATAEIAIRDRDISHMLRKAKVSPLPVGWLRALPAHLRKPRAVLLDTTDAPALLLIHDSPGSGGKLVIRINYRLKKGATMNLVESGRVLDAEAIESIKGRIGKGYTLIDGSL